REMISTAEHYIICIMGERYLPLFENIDVSAPLTLYLISNNPNISQIVEEKLGKLSTSVIYVPMSGINKLAFPPPKKKKLVEFTDFDNIFEIIVDDKETLSIPPLRMNKLTGLHSSTDFMIYMAIDRMEAISGLLIKPPEKKKNSRLHPKPK
ncbi:MAG: hypothetical protein LUQ50_15175, partial [Methanospirillum sp.]|uniref:hypothetical protein n=1 Tax=Methanospirillum sp. TaxID=45200 RepID=UPI0023728223